jgi:hypothetical protein
MTTSEVQGVLQYLKSGSNAKYHASQAGQAREATHEGEYVPQTVPMSNGRLRDDWNLDQQGFALLSHSSNVKNFYNDQELETVYNSEMIQLLKEHTGANRIHIFDHTRRSSSAHVRTKQQMREPSSVIHNDYTEWSATKRLRELLGENIERSRFSIINVWRSMDGPVESWPLALCDSTSLQAGDLHSVQRVAAKDGRIGEIQMATWNPNHRWYSFPRMTPKEVLLIKTYDSSTDVNRYTLHTAFDDESIPNRTSRQSIETRAFCLYE